MKYTCHVCGESYDGEVGHLSYGFKKGQSFFLVICPECRKNLTDEQVEEREWKQASNKPTSILEELGILGH